MIPILIADPDPDFAREIKWALGESSFIRVCASAEDLSQTTTLLAEHKPTVVLLGPGWPEKEIIAFARQTTKRFPSVSLLLLAYKVTSRMVQGAIEAKIKDVLAIPIAPDQIISSINRAHQLAQALEKTSAKIESQPEAKPAPAKHLGKVITVFSTKGGVGKTVVATNLAVSLAQATGTKVVLLDLDLQFGDVGVMLKLHPEHTIYDCLPIADDLDKETLEGLLTPHTSGVKALLAPLEPELADLVEPSKLEKILGALREYADYIIIDTPASFNDHVLTVIDQTDQICLIVTMDIPSVKNTKLCLQTLTSLGYSLQRVKLVINKAETNVGLRQAEIEKALEMKTSITIPTDRNVPLSINKGVPLVLDSPRAAASKCLRDLTKLLESTTEEVAELRQSA